MNAVDHYRRLAGLLDGALAGDANERRLADRCALRVGLAGATAADLGLVAAVLVERVAELDDDTLAAVYGAGHRETLRRVREPARLVV